MFEKEIVVSKNNREVSGLFRMLQDLAGEAAAVWHASGPELAEKGLMWVVVRYDINLTREPEPGETLTVKTWANQIRHRMSQRNYLAFDASGTCILRGSGSWAVVDSVTRSMVDPEERGVQIHGEVNGLEPPRPAAPHRLTLTEERDYEVSGSVLDMNRHMNNTKYFDAVQSCIGDPDSALCLQRVRAMFINEALEGERIRISWGQEENVWFFEGKKNGSPCFQISLEYSCRQPKESCGEA